MSNRHAKAPPDVATIAAILRRLTAEDQAAICAERLDLERRLGRRMSPLAHWAMMLGQSWGVFATGHSAWRRAAELWRALPVERDTDELEAELDRLDSVEGPVAFPLIELPRLRKRSGPLGHDDRKHLMRMRELLQAKTVPSPWAAAKWIVGPDDQETIKRLTRKYADWEADGFPTEFVAE